MGAFSLGNDFVGKYLGGHNLTSCRERLLWARTFCIIGHLGARRRTFILYFVLLSPPFGNVGLSSIPSSPSSSCSAFIRLKRAIGEEERSSAVPYESHDTKLLGETQLESSRVESHDIDHNIIIIILLIFIIDSVNSKTCFVHIHTSLHR